jgi:hypothetical protein
VDSKINSLLKEIDKRMKDQEKVFNLRLDDVRKQMDIVSERAEKTRKKGEEQLEELLTHVES